MKPGWKTTEFWLAVAGKVTGLLALFGVHPNVIPQVDTSIRIGGAALAAASAVGYAISRGLAKSNPTADVGQPATLGRIP